MNLAQLLIVLSIVNIYGVVLSFTYSKRVIKSEAKNVLFGASVLGIITTLLTIGFLLLSLFGGGDEKLSVNEFAEVAGKGMIPTSLVYLFLLIGRRIGLPQKNSQEAQIIGELPTMNTNHQELSSASSPALTTVLVIFSILALFFLLMSTGSLIKLIVIFTITALTYTTLKRKYSPIVCMLLSAVFMFIAILLSNVIFRP